MVRITFGVIVLNGQPFLEYNLRALYPFAHEIIVVEGACTAAKTVATADGHSTDGTLGFLRRFRAENDPENKLLVVTAEDEGAVDGFWAEKDEMSQAYARRATGDWLWQVDYDEFYLEEDMKTILELLESNPEITAVSFPYKQFWGGFDYLETGQWFIYDHPAFHRLFRWRPGYEYTHHRPPTVVDEKGRDLRTLRWVTHQQMRRAGIFLYHYSYVLPKQAKEKVGYYSNVTWSDGFRDSERWLRDRYHRLGDPYHVGEGEQYKTWLVRHRGPHPEPIAQLRQDIACGRVCLSLRATDDIENLLWSPSYALGRLAWTVLLFLNWHVLRRSWPPTCLLRTVMHQIGLRGIKGTLRKTLKPLRKKTMSLIEKATFLARNGWKYRHILGQLDISGFLYESQVLALYDMAFGLPDRHPVVVEIGSWMGKSSFALAKGIKSKSDPVLYCIDPFETDSASLFTETLTGIARSLACSVEQQFIRNMKKNGVYEMIKLLNGRSTEFAATFAEDIDLLFIDGDHSYEAVMRDFEDWSKFLKPGGIIALHDVDFDPALSPTGDEDFVGPGLVAQEKIVNNPEWTDIRLIENLLVAKRVINEPLGRHLSAA